MRIRPRIPDSSAFVFWGADFRLFEPVDSRWNFFEIQWNIDALVEAKKLSGDDTKIGEFLIARGGPFYELQRQLKLLHEDAYHARSRAALFVGLAWGGPLILSAMVGHAWGPFDAGPYLKSFAAWSRFFVATGLFILMERAVESRLRLFLTHFERASILERGSFAAAAQAVTDALKQRDAALAE